MITLHYCCKSIAEILDSEIMQAFLKIVLEIVESFQL